MNTPHKNAPTSNTANAAVRATAANSTNAVDSKAAGTTKTKTKTKSAELPVYIGPEQRKQHRRLARDRRDCFRYELEHDGRRLTAGRRATDKNPWLKYQG